MFLPGRAARVNPGSSPAQEPCLQIIRASLLRVVSATLMMVPVRMFTESVEVRETSENKSTQSSTMLHGACRSADTCHLLGRESVLPAIRVGAAGSYFEEAAFAGRGFWAGTETEV